MQIFLTARVLGENRHSSGKRLRLLYFDFPVPLIKLSESTKSNAYTSFGVN